MDDLTYPKFYPEQNTVFLFIPNELPEKHLHLLYSFPPKSPSAQLVPLLSIPVQEHQCYSAENPIPSVWKYLINLEQKLY